WKEVLSASYSSSTSGNWSWDASDQSGALHTVPTSVQRHQQELPALVPG
ncbi:unnamed protein product, partial [Tetraodon nigroviridis]